MPACHYPLFRQVLLISMTLPLMASCVMKRTVTQHGAVVSGGYIVERPLKAMHDLETTGPDEDDD
jgi:hypothetical protein